MNRLGVVLIALVLGALCPSGHAESATAVARFALLIGVNQSVDASEATLRYADDDAALYFELFRGLGARTYLVTRADENTRRLHPQAVAEAVEPRRVAFDQTIAQLTADMARARALQVRTRLYVIYAGHGSVHAGQGAVALEDAQLTGAELAQLIERSGADEAHVIIDACYSFFLAYPRGPGGRRRPLAGLRQLGPLADSGRIGLLLSTSSAKESHEWEGLQSGVFSYEVRSGLSGAADADGDGQVTYREIAAFVERANAAIPNERFRPDVHARPPATSGLLLDLKPGLNRRVVVPGGAHFVLENADGVRLVDLHGTQGTATQLLRSAQTSSLFLREAGSHLEFAIPSQPEVVKLAMLEPAVARASERGAAHESFGQLFALPFDESVVDAYRFRPLPDFAAEERTERRLGRLRHAGYSLLGVGGAAFMTGAALSLSALGLRDQGVAGRTQSQIAVRNGEIDQRNLGAVPLYISAAALAVSGAVVLLLPKLRPNLMVAPAPDGGTLEWRAEF
jgi:hypothetical protein